MSSSRSRSDGMRSGITLRRKYRSCRNRPAVASAERSRLEVAITRTSTRMVLVPPTRSNSCSCSTRNSFAWRSRRSSDISSRSSVPRFARSNAPSTRLIAPVNAPFSWPNSALSISPSGSAAQFSLMKGLSWRSLMSWIARANNSLPVPDSPRRRTVARVGAAVATDCRALRITALSPRICRSFRTALISRRSVAFSFRSATSSSACSTASVNCSGRKGFVM